ncbi:MAG: FkbM family methyltransferase [Flavobacteriales bacterium]|nr:FkbM family methyltransferase [Flavobacteriales bacterium]MCB9499664.1 FkbM family methyltransferase [Erysipelotrichaceae bacterium]
MILFIIRVLNKFRLLTFFNINATILLNDKEFRIPILSKLGLSNLYMSEPWMIDLLKVITQIGNEKFVDVGVNVGQTLLKLKSVSNDINYIGFEPNPSCVNYSTKLIKLNNFKNTLLFPFGIADKTQIAELVFFYESDVDSSASIIQNFRPNQTIHHKEYVPIFDVNSIKTVASFDDISIIKIDVEGAELEIIRTFKETIKKANPIMMVEVLPVYNAENKDRLSRQNEIEAILKECNYSIFRVNKVNETLKGFKELQEIGIHSDLNDCEYIFMPNSKKELFNSLCQNKNLSVVSC